MLRIGPEPANGSISAINIRDNEKVVGILKEPTGEYSLDVSGTINCDTLLVNGTVFSGGGGGSGVWDLSDSNTISYTNGNVGIGTTSPSEKLQVNGNVELRNIDSDGDVYLSMFEGTADNGMRLFVDGTDNALQIQGVSTGTATAIMTVERDGNVGIGTTTPAYELDVSGNIYANENIYANGRMYIYDSYLTLDNSVTGATNGIHIKMKHKDATHDARALVVHQDTADILQINYGYDFDTVRINNTVFIDGSCGIGLTDPAYELDVSGNIGIRGSGNGIIGQLHGSLVIQSQGNGTGEGLFLENINRSNNDMNISINILADDGIHFNVNDTTDRMYINETGVGIGTTNPTAPLYVLGNSSPCVIVKYPGNRVTLQDWQYVSDSGSQRGMTLFSPGDWSSYSFSGPANTFIFRTADAFSFYTDDNHVCHMSSVGAFIVYNFVNSSDDRLKSNEIPITDALTTIMKLNPMTYDKYNNMDKSGNYFRESGLISQDIWYQVPELRHIVTLGSEYKDGTSTVPTPIDVSNNELLEDADYNNLGWSTTEPSSVKYLGLIAYLIKAVQELNIQRQQEKDALQASHDSLKDEMAELKALLQEKSII